MKLPRSVGKLIENFERLPGIGPKTAARLTFYLLSVPQSLLDEFGETLKSLRLQTVTCSVCFNVAETDPCPICTDQNRNHAVICVVEQPLDVLALEKSGKYNGVYHVLGGVIDPLNNIGPDEIRIKQLLERVKNPDGRLSNTEDTDPPAGGEGIEIREVILATDPDMEGEATAMYIANEVRKFKIPNSKFQIPKITRLGQGLPTGADIEYADETTLERAMEGRKIYA